MSASPLFLLDTCSIINLTYSPAYSALIKKTLVPNMGWVEAVRIELTTQSTRRPPHPNAGMASRWAVSCLGTPMPIIEGQADLGAIARIQANLRKSPNSPALENLGEATTIHYLHTRGSGILLSDDHLARSEARTMRVRATSTVALLSKIIRSGNASLTVAEVDDYLDKLRNNDRMQITLSASDLQNGRLGSWL